MSLDPASLLLNVVVYAAGILTCRLLFHRFEGAPMPESKPARKRPGWSAVVFGIVLLAIGAQQLQYQANSDADDRRIKQNTDCVSRWGQEMSEWGADVVETIGTRTDATQRLEAAKERRANAVDRIINVVILGRSVPPRADEKDFDRALVKFAAAKANLRSTRKSTKQTRDENPYPAAPVLNCVAGGKG